MLFPEQVGRRLWFLSSNEVIEALLLPQRKIQAHVQAGEGEYPAKEIPLCLPQSLVACCQ